MAERNKLVEDTAARDIEIRQRELDEEAKVKKAKEADLKLEADLALARRKALQDQIESGNRLFLQQQKLAKEQAADAAIRATREEVERYDLALDALAANPALSDQEKQRERIRLIDEQTAAIQRARAALEAFMAANPGVDVGGLTSALQALGDKGARNAGLAQPAQTLEQRDAIALRDLTDPAKSYQTAAAGAQGGASQFLASLGTQADNVADMVNGGLNSALGETSNFLYNLATGAMTFREAWDSAILAVGQNFARMASDMVAKLIWKNTVERGLTAMGVTFHLSGEAAKTAGTGTGVVKRLALVAKEALADVYHGAVAAFKAMAGIPVIGPVLGAGALAAALALGIGLVGKIGGHAAGGIVQGGRQLSWLNEEGTEAVIRAPSVRRFGAGFLSDLNEGVLNLDALPGNIAAQLPGAADQVALSSADASPSSGGAGAGAPRIYMLMDRAAFVRAMQEDSQAWFQDMSSTFARKNS